MTRTLRSALLLSFVVAGCQQRVDVAHETDALLQADRAWAAAATEGKNADSVLSFWADDATVAMPGAPVTRGKPALKQMVTGLFGTPNFKITWTPEHAVVSASGDLGYTTGSNAVTVTDSTGKATTEVARYLTVWRKGADGRWRCVEDYASPGPVATPART